MDSYEKRLYTFIIPSLLFGFVTFLGCASTQSTPQSTMHHYADACRSKQTESAQKLVSPNSIATDICPDEETTETLRQKIDFNITASIGSTTFIRQNDGYRLQADWLTQPESPQNLWMRLEIALKNSDADALYKLLTPNLARKYTSASLKQLMHEQNSGFNEIYAAMAITPSPWFDIQNHRAICEAAGKTITFAAIQGTWHVAELGGLIH